MELRTRDFAAGRGGREEALKQEKSGDNVQEAHHYGCVSEGEPHPPRLWYLHLFLRFLLLLSLSC